MDEELNWIYYQKSSADLDDWTAHLVFLFLSSGAMLNIVQDSALLESIGAQTETVRRNLPVVFVFFNHAHINLILQVLRRQRCRGSRGA